MKATAEVMRARLELKKIRAEADTLGMHVDLARAFATSDYGFWSSAPRTAIAMLMDVAIVWTLSEDRDVEVTVPRAISQSRFGILNPNPPKV